MKSTLKNILEKKINKRLICPVVLAVLVYLLSYQIPKVFSFGELHFLSLPIDEKIPVIPFFAVIYFLSFVQWLYAISFIMKEETSVGYYFSSAIIIGSLIGFMIFTFYPTATLRPEITGNSIFNWLLRVIRFTDSIKNGFPSYHCFCSVIACVILNHCKEVKKSTVNFNIFFTILVFISTVCTKQHYFIDIPGGILLAIISLLLAKKITFTSLFDSLNEKLLKKE